MPDSGTEFAISAPNLFDGEHFLPNHCVVIRGDTVQRIVPAADCPAALARVELASGTLAPGFVDLQVNGGGDLMFNNVTSEATVHAMLAAHRATGTTALLPTLISDTPERQRQAVAAVRAARAAGNSGVLGIHLEGPHFEPARRGAHQAAQIRPPQQADIDWLCSLQGLAVLLTLAPEHCAPGQIRQLSASGIRVCAGHTNASYEQVLAACEEGLQGVTHLYNAMSPLTARAPGTVGAALEADALWAGIIADGHHVHPAAIRLAHRAKPAGRLVLVSDAMATVGGSDSSFELYGETIRIQGGKLVNADGALAGSAIGMIEAVRYAAEAVGLPLAECLRMASLYPAAILGLAGERGRIAAGFRADLVHFDAKFNVQNTWLGGQQKRH